MKGNVYFVFCYLDVLRNKNKAVKCRHLPPTLLPSNIHNCESKICLFYRLPILTFRISHVDRQESTMHGVRIYIPFILCKVAENVNEKTFSLFSEIILT